MNRRDFNLAVGQVIEDWVRRGQIDPGEADDPKIVESAEDEVMLSYPHDDEDPRV